jgi:hypothetical protein
MNTLAIFRSKSLTFIALILNKNRFFHDKKKGDEIIHLLSGKIFIPDQVKNWDTYSFWEKQRSLLWSG